MKENCEIIYKNIEENEEYESTIKEVVNECFKEESLDKANIYMSITLTDEEEIEKINKQYRNIDKATDVLSFPMFEKKDLEKFIQENVKATDINMQGDILGDIVISIPRVKKQAEEYGHSFERELAYMVVHGFYHLMGYDHIKEEDKKIMRKKEENILNKLGIRREEEKKDKDEDNKKTSNSNFIDSWKNAANGIIYAATTQRNVKIQLVIAVCVVIISLFFDLSKAEFLIFLFTIVLILLAEMFNTAIETVVDLYIDVYHPKAKIAKDVAAGGVVITAINAVIVAYFLFFDKISDIGVNFIRNIIESPVHLAFTMIIIVLVAIIALIAIAKSNKHKGLNKKFVPSGFTALAFAANTIIWLMTDNVVILMLALVLALLVAISKIESKVHRTSEVIFSACVGIFIVLLVYGIAIGVMNIIA